MTQSCYINSMATVEETDLDGLISQGSARRMSRILRNAVSCSLAALRDGDVDLPDAIITGTGMGCMENSEKFLIDMCRYGESCLKPSLFMQSTHNTISSQIAIALKCHGYNTTYSHNGISFESALLDAWIQMRTGQIGSALVGAYDEVSHLMRKIMKRIHPEYSRPEEISVAFVLTSERSVRNLCEIMEVKLFHSVEPEYISKQLEPRQDKILMLGLNGVALNDEPYERMVSHLRYKPDTIQYRNSSGDNYTVSAKAVYNSARLLHESNQLDSITILNHSEGSSWAMVRLIKA